MSGQVLELPIASADVPRLIRDAVQASEGALTIARMSRNSVDIMAVGAGGTVVKLSYRPTDDGATRFETGSAVTAVLMGGAQGTDTDHVVAAIRAVWERWQTA